jgi:hypothetical protein
MLTDQRKGVVRTKSRPSVAAKDKHVQGDRTQPVRTSRAASRGRQGSTSSYQSRLLAMLKILVTNRSPDGYLVYKPCSTPTVRV